MQYERLRAERSLSDDQLLRSMQPEDLAPCYSFVKMQPYTERPSPSVQYWREREGQWQVSGSCGG